MDPITLSLLIGGGLSAIASIFASKTAAKAQTGAAQAGIAAQLAMFGITRAGLSPYMAGGNSAFARLMGTARVPGKAAANWVMTKDGRTMQIAPGKMNQNYLANLKKQGWGVKTAGHAAVAARAATPGMLKSLVKPVSINLEQLQKTPGYQFALGQGEKAVTNQLTARGLGMSGSEVKGAETFAAGLASQTFQQEFQRQMANKEMAYNMLMGPSQLGESAAAGVGTAAMGTGSGISQSLANIGSAQAGAAMNIGNAVGDFGNSLVASQILPGILANAHNPGPSTPVITPNGVVNG